MKWSDRREKGSHRASQTQEKSTRPRSMSLSFSLSKNVSNVTARSIAIIFIYYDSAAEKAPHFHESYRDGQRKRIYDGLEPEHYFHYEYQLLPPSKGQQGQSFKTDVVVFGGVVSKVYTEKDCRVVQCWSEEEQFDLSDNHFGWRHK